MTEDTKLTRSDYADQREIRFASIVAHSDDAVFAYKAVYLVASSTTWSDTKIAIHANRVLNRPRVRNLITLERKMMAGNVDFGPREVFQEWLDIATADVNELVSHRRTNCRHCHGIDHQYQWRDEAEWADELARVLDWNMANPESVPKAMPSDAGGFGYTKVAGPVDTCPQCDGEGYGEIIAHDTRALSPQARKLYGGVKMTKNGPEIIIRDQDAALANIAKALGMFTEKVELSGPGGGPIPIATMALPTDPLEAAKVYQAIMKAKPI